MRVRTGQLPQLEPANPNQPNRTAVDCREPRNIIGKGVESVRRQIPRKTDMVRAIDLRPRRLERGLTADQMADILQFSDGKHVCSVETGRSAITAPTMIRQAYSLGVSVVELIGMGGAVTLPFDLAQLGRPAPRTNAMSAGEAAWIALQEAREAIECISGLQDAISRRDRARLVYLGEQLVCDPMHAFELVVLGLDAYDPTIMIEARVNHGRKLVKKGLTPFFVTRPLDAA